MIASSKPSNRTPLLIVESDLPGSFVDLKLGTHLFVAEADRFKREERFAGLIHGFDVVFVASRGDLEAEFAASAYSNKDAVSLRRRADVSNARHVALPSKTKDALADTDIATSRDIETGFKAQANVGAAGCVEIERMGTAGRVKVASCVVKERDVTVGRVVVTDGVGKERFKTGGRVVESGSVEKECSPASGRVSEPGGVVEERCKTKSGVIDPAGYAKKVPRFPQPYCRSGSLRQGPGTTACALGKNAKQTRSTETRSGGIVVLNRINGFIGPVIFLSLFGRVLVWVCFRKKGFAKNCAALSRQKAATRKV